MGLCRDRVQQFKIRFLVNTAVGYNSSAVGGTKNVPDKEDGEEETSPPISEIVDKIYRLESSAGKNDWCKTNGAGYNGYGYAQSKSVWMCYDTQEEVRELVEKWFTEKLKNNTLETALCIYNQGIKTSACKYVDLFNAI